MKYLFVNYEIAKQLKEKGFNEPCLSYYNSYGKFQGVDSFKLHKSRTCVDSCSLRHELYAEVMAPTHQQAIDWFREKHCIHISLRHHTTSQTYGFVITGKYEDKNQGELLNDFFLKITYYEALNQAITESIKLIQ